MKAIVRTLLLGAAGLVSLATTAVAADMDAPLYETPPEMLAPVEIGNGWYLRGDVAYDMKSDVDVDYKTFSYRAGNPNVIAYGDESYDTFEIKDGPAFGVGAGYQFTDMFRGDLTAHYWKHDVSGSDLRSSPCVLPFGAGASCRQSDGGDVAAWELMANAYIDLGNFAGFTPYVGAGAGAVHLEYSSIGNSNHCIAANGSDCGLVFGRAVEHEGIDSWRFAYAAMAGISYDINQSLKLDVGYRYLNVDEGDAYSFTTTDIGLGAAGAQAKDGGFDRHTIQAGLRYSLF